MKGIYVFHHVQTNSGVHLAFCTISTRGSFLGGKAVIIKNIRVSAAPYVFIAWCLIEYGDNFAFTVTFCNGHSFYDVFIIQENENDDYHRGHHHHLRACGISSDHVMVF
jgi:hypothetical protein